MIYSNALKLKQLINDTSSWDNLTNEEIVVECNTPSILSIKDSYFIRMRTLFADLSPTMAMEIKTRLQLFADSTAAEAPVVAEILDWITSTGPGTGLDISHSTTRTMVDSLVAATVLTSEQGQALKSLGEELISPAQNVGLGIVKVGHVIKAKSI